MELSEFEYELPKSLIAQTPVEPRDSSKLMVLKENRILHRRFLDFVDYLDCDDVLVLNDSKVLPARLFGKKQTQGKAEVLLVTRIEDNIWECLVKGKNIRKGTSLDFGDHELTGLVRKPIDGGRFQIEFRSRDDLQKILKKIGTMPTPPYIKEHLEDQSRYQTVYAKKEGSIAAPTAGLHFTEKLLSALRKKGVKIVYITLHVSVGTFLPVKERYLEKHKMEPEFFSISSRTAEAINTANADGKKIVAVGTTTLKSLESSSNEKGRISPCIGESDLFIYPGHSFKTNLSGLLTNFHLPRSTLIMLVSAYAGKDTIFEAYSQAIKRSYRFYSFGDAMLILK